MDLKDIMSISGKAGLHKNIAQSKSGIIVESLIDGKRFQVFASDKISALGEISIYTTGEELALREVFRLIREKLGEELAPDTKASDKQLVEFFEGIIPEYDKEKFYISHMRKLVGWYNLLVSKGITDFSEPVEDSDESSSGSSGDETLEV
ncbi:MAG: DUF5606 domain-containing protein [Bacteroidetes bacterium]|nr:DUF5606 domain-containing protein [Bacteroidota bacterium]